MDPTDVARVMGERIRRRALQLPFPKDALAADAGQFIVFRAEAPVRLRGGFLLFSDNVAAGAAAAEFALRKEPGVISIGTLVSTSPGRTALTAVSFALSEIEVDTGGLVVLTVSKVSGGVLLPTWFFNLEYDLVTPT